MGAVVISRGSDRDLEPLPCRRRGVVGVWVASSWVPRNPGRGWREHDVPGFGSRKFCCGCSAGSGSEGRPRVWEAGEEADVVIPAGKLTGPTLGGGYAVCGEGRKQGLQGPGGGWAGLAIHQTWNDEEGALMWGLGWWVGGGACPDSALGARGRLWPRAQGRPDSPSGRSRICPDRSWGMFQPHPRCAVFGFELPASFPVSVTDQCPGWTWGGGVILLVWPPCTKLHSHHATSFAFRSTQFMQKVTNRC